MFTIPASGSGIPTARPSASSGTITNPANAYDLPSGRPDDQPYTTSADRALVSGSFVAGLPDYATVEYNSFTARSKANFSYCQLVIGFSSIINDVVVSNTATIPPGNYYQNYVTAGLSIEYSIDGGTTWIRLGTYGTVSNLVTGSGGGGV